MATAKTTKTTPAAAEALDAPVPVEFRGVTYQVANTAQWPYAALVALEEGRLVAFLKLILGDAEHDRFAATAPLVADTGAFIDTIQTALGVSGN